MILHFHAADVEPGESAYLNICFECENYNFDIYPDAHYIEVSRDELDAIYKECDFNEYWPNDDLHAPHDIDAALLDAAIMEQADEANRDDLTEQEIINNRFR